MKSPLIKRLLKQTPTNKYTIAYVTHKKYNLHI
jgi:hypothetical protein